MHSHHLRPLFCGHVAQAAFTGVAWQCLIWQMASKSMNLDLPGREAQLLGALHRSPSLCGHLIVSPSGQHIQGRRALHYDVWSGQARASF